MQTRPSQPHLDGWDRHRLDIPDLISILCYAAVRREEAGGSGVQDAAARPLCLVAVQSINFVLRLHVGGEVVGHQEPVV